MDTSTSTAGLLAVGVDERIANAFDPFASFVEGVVFYSVGIGGAALPLIVVWLIAAAVIFTVYFRAINLRGFGTAVALVRGKYTDPDDRGEVSHFGALTAAVSGTVGLGNIAASPSRSPSADRARRSG